jgi:hypothetical protein
MNSFNLNLFSEQLDSINNYINSLTLKMFSGINVSELVEVKSKYLTNYLKERDIFTVEAIIEFHDNVKFESS